MWSKFIITIFAIIAVVLSYEYAPFYSPSESLPPTNLSPVPAPLFPEVVLKENSSDFSSGDAFSHSLDSLIKPLESLVPNPQPVPVDSPVLNSTSAPPAPVSNPDPGAVFNRLWPDYYRAALSDIQDFLVSQGYLSSSAQSELDSSESIFRFLNDFASVYQSVANLSSSEYGSLLSRLDSSVVIKSQQRQEIIGDLSLVNRLFSWLNLKPAIVRASYVSTAGGGLCYKDDAPGNTAPGVSSPIFACNDGFHCNADGCTYVSDCGPYSASCNVDLGCLNRICSGFQNAIWDPGSGMCGCG